MTQWFYGTLTHQPGFNQTRGHGYFSLYYHGTVTGIHGTVTVR